jgi:hypothetical protein
MERQQELMSPQYEPPLRYIFMMKTLLTYCAALAIFVVCIPLMLIAALCGERLPLSPSDPPPGGNDDAS